MAFEIGTYHFGELTRDPFDGHVRSAEVELANLLEQAVLADEVGLDVFAVGEHHRSDFAVSAPSVVLAAVAARTGNIRLSSAVTVLGSEDPVRLFEQFATLDLLSGGRAEIMVGKGSYAESFVLAGLDPADQRELFRRNLDTLLAVQRDCGVFGVDVAPRPSGSTLPIWLAGSSRVESIERYARYGLPLAVPMLGGQWRSAVPGIDLFRELAEGYGFDARSLPISMNTAGFVASTTAAAFDIAQPHYAAGRMQNFHTRNEGAYIDRADLEMLADESGPLMFGSPAQLIDKILTQHRMLGHDRLLIQMSYGSVPQPEALKAIELLGTEVAPVVRREIQSGQGLACVSDVK